MGRANTENRQLRALADLLRKANEAPDLKRLADVIVSHVREAVPPRKRNPMRLKSIHERILQALDEIYAEAVPYNDHHAAIVERNDKAFAASPQRVFAETMQAAASLLDQTGEGDREGAALRAAIDPLVTAARNLACRLCSIHALSVVRDYERPGAPPALIYMPNGLLLWENFALRDFLDRRGVDRLALLNVTSSFAGPFCLHARKASRPEPRKAGRVPHPPVFLQGSIVRADGTDDAAIVVTVSEARRVTELSNRELQVARALCVNDGYQGVADALGISLDSVRTHLRRAYRKLGVSNRHDMKDRLIRDGHIKPELAT